MTAPAPAPQAPRPTPEAGTEYIISTKKDATTWDKSGTRTARSAEAAIRDFLSTANAVTAEGTFAAIPVRSFKPVTVKAQTVTMLKLEEAK